MRGHSASTCNIENEDYMDKVLLNCISLKTPVTALHWCNYNLLIGSGGLLRVINYRTSCNNLQKKGTQISIFPSSTIHGIKSFHHDAIQSKAVSSNFQCPHHVAVYGGKDVAIMEAQGDTFIASNNFKFSDWVHDVEPLKNNCLAVALAHNSVVLYNWLTSTVCKQVHCYDKCILYSASFAFGPIATNSCKFCYYVLSVKYYIISCIIIKTI